MRKAIAITAVAAAICIGIALTNVSGDPVRSFAVPFIVCAVCAAIFAYLYLATLIVVAIHELGHYAAARMVRFRSQYVRIGPLNWRWRETGVEFCFRRGSLGGYVSAVPSDRNRLKLRYLVFIAGGPIATILTLVVALKLPPLLGTQFFALGFGSPDREHPIQQIALTALVLVTLLIAVATLIPYNARGVATDALQIVQLASAGESGSRTFALLDIGRRLHEGQRARDWDPELLKIALVPADRTLARCGALYCNYWYHLDRQEPDLAGPFIQEAADIAPTLSSLLEAFNQTYLFECAYWTARYRGEGDKACELIAKIKNPTKEIAHLQARAQAAIALAKQDPTAAIEQANKAETIIKSLHKVLRDNDKAEIELLEQIRAQATSSLPSEGEGGKR